MSFRLELTPDPREAAMIEAKRKRAEERKQRIFDTKQRTMGMDYAALEAQIREKEERHKREKELERIAAEEQMRQARVGLMLEREAMEQMRRQRQADDEFRMAQTLQATRRREEEEREPAPTPGPSSLVDMDGYDPGYAERALRMRQQQEEWALQQLQEQIAAEERQKEKEAAFQRQETMQAQRAIEIANQEAENRRRIERETAEYNKKMFEEKKRRAAEEKQREREDNFNDIMAAVNSDLISERREAAQSFGPKKILPDRYKGMTETELQAIREEQQKQATLDAAKRQKEREAEELAQKQAALQSRQALLQERALQRLHAEQLRLEQEANLRLAEEQREKRKQEQANLGKNEISNDFFDFFNRDAR